jgi:hypothetical protein
MLLLVPPVTEKDKPSLPKLLQFKVHEKVGANYLELSYSVMTTALSLRTLKPTASGKFSTSFAGFSLPGSRGGASQSRGTH